MKAQKLGATEMLSREQLKKVTGGGPCGTGETRCCCGTSCICVPEPNCQWYPCCGRVWC